MNIGDWTKRFQGTRNLPRAVRDRLIASVEVLQFQAGDQVFRPNMVPDSLFFYTMAPCESRKPLITAVAK